MRKIFKIPDHWRSTEWQTEQYLKNTGQARMSRGLQHARQEHTAPELLPEEPIAGYEEPALRHYSLQKKLGASVLAAATLFTWGSQYAASLHEQPTQAKGDTTSHSEVCSDNVTTMPAMSTSETFVFSGAYNDPLSEVGEQTTLAQFEQSSTLQDLQEYVQVLPEATAVSAIEVHGTASDDNRSNIEAGIGRIDEINQRTATSYANIATRAIKKLLSGRAHEAQFSQSSEERLLTAEEQRTFDTVRRDANMSTSTDLLSAYNNVASALDETNRQTLDRMIDQHRGAEITIHTTTPAQTVGDVECKPATGLLYTTPVTSERPSTPLPPFAPVAVLPVWRQVTRLTAHIKKKVTETDNYPDEHSPAPVTRRERLLRPLNNTVSAIKGQVQHMETTAPQQAKRLMKRPQYLVQDSAESIDRHLRELRKRQAELNRFAQIPVSELRTLDRDQFYKKYGVFRDDYYDATKTNKSLPLRRIAVKFARKSQ